MKGELPKCDGLNVADIFTGGSLNLGTVRTNGGRLTPKLSLRLEFTVVVVTNMARTDKIRLIDPFEIMS